MDSKDKNKDLFPWESEEGRRKKPERGDSIPSNTSMKSRVHSKPKISGQEYLDVYIMLKEKDRIEKYGKTLGKRLGNISDGWRDVKKIIVDQEQNLPKVPRGGLEDVESLSAKKTKQTKKTPRNIKKVDWNY